MDLGFSSRYSHRSDEFGFFLNPWAITGTRICVIIVFGCEWQGISSSVGERSTYPDFCVRRPCITLLSTMLASCCHNAVAELLCSLSCIEVHI